jgi:hypothetical protein
MTQSTQVGDPTLASSKPRGAARVPGRAWEKIRLGLVRTLLWTYERGSWQYDLIVLTILAFIFLAPRGWFSDRPTLQLTDLRHAQGMVEMGRDREGSRYLLDARLVESLEPLKPEDSIRELLQRRLKKPFKVKTVAIVRDKNQVVLGYTVVVEE